MNRTNSADRIKPKSPAILLGVICATTSVLAQPFPARVDLNSIAPDEGIIYLGADLGDHVASTVAGVGDLENDGLDEIGITSLDSGPDEAGQVYVILGNTTVISPVVTLDELDGFIGFQINGVEPHSATGSSIEGAGDVNGDGLGDTVIGSPHIGAGAGSAYLLFGRTETGITLGATGGACPGTIRLRSKGLTPDGVFGLYRGSGRGITVLPGGACEGTQVDLDNAVLVSQIEADPDGRWTFAIDVSSENACGLLLQAIDLERCAVSNVAIVPEG